MSCDILLEDIDLANSYGDYEHFLELSGRCNSKKKISNVLKILQEAPFVQSIDLSKNKRILKHLPKICEELTRSYLTLICIDFSFCDLKENHCNYISDLLRLCQNLKKIHLDGNSNSNKGLINIFEALQVSCGKIIEISVTSCNLTTEECEEFGNLLRHCKNLEKIRLDKNDNMNNRMENIFAGLNHVKILLRDLNLSSCNIKADHCKDLSKFLSNALFLNKINLSFNDNLDEGLFYICNALNKKNTLNELNFYSCKLTETQTKYISKLFQNCYFLKKINLGMNRFMENGFSEICESLKMSYKHLKEINCYSCKLDSKQIRCFISLLSKCLAIKTIDLNGKQNFDIHYFHRYCLFYNPKFKTLRGISIRISESECEIFSTCLFTSTRLRKIDVSGSNKFGKGLADLLCALEKSCQFLNDLNFFSCNLDEIEARALGILIGKCKKLKIINLGNNPNMLKGIFKIFSNLEKSKNTLMEINFQKCNLAFDECKGLKELLRICRKLEIINISENLHIENGWKLICDEIATFSKAIEELNLTNCGLRENDKSSIKTIFQNQNLFL